MHEKKNFAKSTKSDAWLSKRMIAKSKNQTSTINAVKYQKTWENLFEFDEIEVDKKWHKAIVHGI